MAAGNDGVSAMLATGWHRLGGGKEKGGRGSNGFVFGIRFGFGRRGVNWSEWVEWSGVDRKIEFP